MSESNKPLDSTEPGPFQKYLFSGACYVQIGECYKLLKVSIARGETIKTSGELTENLKSIWTGFLVQQPGALASEISAEGGGQLGQETEALKGIHQNIVQAGATATDHFLASIVHTDVSTINLKQFFVLWASSCDSAYQQLIWSDSYSRAVGQIVNSTLDGYRLTTKSKV